MAGQFFLGIEGGATRTTGVVTDGDLRVVARFVGEPTNVFAVGRDNAKAALVRMLVELLPAAGIRQDGLAASALCIAGVRGEKDRQVWREIAEEVHLREPLVITHDAAAGLAAGSPDATGILAVCGTGSLVYGRRADEAERFAGGRGPILGDEGSGFDIGHRALRAAVRASDGRGRPTLLERLIPERLGLGSIDDLVPWVSPFAKDRVASVAPIVFEAAGQGDEVAAEIVAGAAEELARAVIVVATALWPPAGEPDTGTLKQELERGTPVTKGRSRVPRPSSDLGVPPGAVPHDTGPKRVVLAGGVLRHQAGFRERVAAGVAEQMPGVRCGLPEVEGAVGAAPDRAARFDAASLPSDVREPFGVRRGAPL